MPQLANALAYLEQQLTVSLAEISAIAASFHAAIGSGLAGEKSSLTMLPAHLGKPTGQEQGHFLALDFGGTTIRVLLVELDGQQGFHLINRRAAPLKDDWGQYNYVSPQSSATALFDFIASQIAGLVDDNTFYALGHTFSYPTRQTGCNNAILLNWTKEINTPGVIGQDINTLLFAALKRRGLPLVVPQVIINDTVGTLLAAAYQDQHTDIGSICGTGHNTAYLEPHPPWTKQPMIINLESGNFDQLSFTMYDQQLDQTSEQPGQQRLEKMVSGRYIGELLRFILVALLRNGLFTDCAAAFAALDQPNILTGQDVAVLLADDSPPYEAIACWLTHRLGLTTSKLKDRAALKAVASLLATRSARLITATYLGILQHIDPTLQRCHNIGIDGSLYEKLPGYANTIETTFTQCLQEKASQITVTLTKDGSGIGAAIATAIVQKSQCNKTPLSIKDTEGTT